MDETTVTLPDPADMTDQYNTKLSPAYEKKFLEWAKQNNRLQDLQDYDMRGAWLELQKRKIKWENGHLTDKYKKPSHPTFSSESKYHGKDGHVGGSWVKDAEGAWTYVPSETNLKFRSREELQDYFKRVEPGVTLWSPPSLLPK